ncbi:formin domain containing protein [Chrysochromulina tobinii]|uniref:Formin domain containing protein n=1 Tax=Chrysochromulina tobinii TaxID=1460289 RepID=A0A0M0JBR1_9EUKA|nr:formin domain containing protein [Chrysochromulina tobinii]|eukprot:KOO23999.1 formin domain containing protein [Chrysochromulina sp. CCMP291]
MGEPSFDMQRFESLFVAKEPAKPTVMVRGSSSSVVGSAQASLLDPKRSNHFGIILKQVKVSLEEMRRAVVALDEKVLTPDAVAALQKCVPLPEEIELVSAADPAALGFAEKFVLQGSFRAGAEGFRLECLPRLAELKTNDHRSSLLQYALAVHGGQEPDTTKGPADFLPVQPPLTSFADKCKSVRAAAKLSLENVNEEVARLKAGLSKIEAELEHFREQARAAHVDAKAKAAASVEGGVAVLSAREEALARDQYLQVMGSFRDGATAQVEELGCAALRMEEMHKVLRSFFAEESKTSIEEIFSRWATFLGQVDAAVAHHNEDRAKAAKVK